MLGLWQKADNNSAKSHRKLVDAINGLGNLSPSGDLYTERSQAGTGVLDKRRTHDDEYRDGIIVAKGPANEPGYLDERYWIQVAATDKIVTDQTDGLRATASPAVNVQGSSPPVKQPNIFTVTNRYELLPDGSGVHTLPIGRWVRFRPVFDGDGQKRYAMEEPPGILLGLVVCYGPCGENDYDDCRYWIEFAKPANHSGSPTAKIVVVPDIRFPPPPCGSVSRGATKNHSKIVTATHFAEYDSDTHLVRPGTPVILEWVSDPSNPTHTLWSFRIADFSDAFPECPPPSQCCNCYEVATSADDSVPPIQLNQIGPRGWANADGTVNIFLVSMVDGLKWRLTFADGSTWVADGMLPCPPVDVTAWTHVDSSGPTTLFSIACCEASSSSASSSACCDCYQVQYTRDETVPPIQMHQVGDNSWTNDDDSSYINGDGNGGWSLTISSTGGDTSVFSASGPCPPTDPSAWTNESGPLTLIDIQCCGSSSSSSGSSSASSASSGSSSASSGSASASGSGPGSDSGCACPPMPCPPGSDGDYVLVASMSGGICSLSWEPVGDCPDCGTQ